MAARAAVGSMTGFAIMGSLAVATMARSASGDWAAAAGSSAGAPARGASSASLLLECCHWSSANMTIQTAPPTRRRITSRMPKRVGNAPLSLGSRCGLGGRGALSFFLARPLASAALPMMGEGRGGMPDGGILCMAGGGTGGIAAAGTGAGAGGCAGLGGDGIGGTGMAAGGALGGGLVGGLGGLGGALGDVCSGIALPPDSSSCCLRKAS